MDAADCRNLKELLAKSQLSNSTVISWFFLYIPEEF
jgi:hypothetical protein